MNEKLREIINNKQIIQGFFVGIIILSIVGMCRESDSNETYISKNTENFVGTYTTTDAVGTKLTFTLSEDGTVKCYEEYKTIYGLANSYSNEYGDHKQTATKTHYGHWRYLSIAIPCEITINNGPNIYFNANDRVRGYKYQIKNGYLYTDIDDCKSAHPERRLKLTKK